MTINTKIAPRFAARIGQRVRVLSGAAVGQEGVIENIDTGPTTSYRARFEPPIYLPAVGRVAAVWRTTVELEELR